MRPRRSDRRLLSCVLAAAIAGAGSLGAQSAGSAEGALFLLLPVGARAAGMGQSVSASSLGGESTWWNPGGLGEVQQFEILLHHSQSIIGTGDALSVVAPFPLLGVFALSASTINFGEQELGDIPGSVTGVLVPRSFVFAASYATALGSWFRAGLSYKLVQMRADCSGACQDLESFTSSTSAVDVGAQFSRQSVFPLAIGAAVRNVGPRLQVVDTEQADALPSRIHLGLDYRWLALERSVKNTQLHLTLELVDRLKVSRPDIGMGTEISYEDRLFFRAGYLFEEGSGASLGGGIRAGNLVIDISRILGGLSADIGEPPTHISLRYRFR